jgi:hypothetical protein
MVPVYDEKLLDELARCYAMAALDRMFAVSATADVSAPGGLAGRTGREDQNANEHQDCTSVPTSGLNASG